MSRPVTEQLLAACPFLDRLPQEDWDCGDTIAFGDVARWLRDGTLRGAEAEAVFELFNYLAETGDENTLEVLATGALETFNDDAASQQMAQQHLTGAALKILEEMRVSWGQPDYGTGSSK